MVLAAQGKKINQISIDEIDWLTKLRRGLEETRKGFVTELLDNWEMTLLHQNLLMI